VQGKGLRDRAPQLNAKNVVVLGASFDSVEDNKKFAEKFSFPFLLLSDPERKLGVLYGAAEPGATSGNARRVAYVIDEAGKIKKVWEKVDTKVFADEVLASL
jgi:peroxiredoxin Q/BCP